MSTALQRVSLTSIDANPWRNLDVYPWREEKLAALQESIRSTGFWEGVICRKVGRRYECAFGHHRLEAAKRVLGNSAKVPIVVKDLDDGDMLALMGRENQESYNADFLIMFEAWDAAVDHLSELTQVPEYELQVTDVAKFLGWVRLQKQRTGKPRLAATYTAEACAKVRQLLDEKHMDLDEFNGMTVDESHRLASATLANLRSMERIGKRELAPPKIVEQAKKTVISAAKKTAKDIKAKAVAPKAISHTVSSRTSEHLVRKGYPEFTEAAARTCRTISGWLNNDVVSEQINAFIKAAPLLETDEQFQLLDRLVFELKAGAKRHESWAKRVEKVRARPKGAKVVKLKSA